MQQNISDTALFQDVLDQWVTPKGFVEIYPQFTLPQLYWVIGQRKLNGLENQVL